MSEVKIGIIGTGGIARARHLPACVKNDKVALVAAADVSEASVRKAGADFNIPNVYTDYREMLEKESLDGVIICTPNKFHAPAAIDALHHGVHVLCEKPMAMNAQEARAMVQASKETGKQLAVAYHFRFRGPVQAAKRVIDAGELGDIYMGRVYALRRRGIPSWGVFTNMELQGGGAMVDFGVHFLDTALYLLGNPKVVEVSGVTSQHLGKKPTVNPWGSWDHQNFQVEDHAAALIRFENGKALSIEASWALNIPKNVENVSLSGTEGGLDVFPFQVNKAAHGMLLNWEPQWMPNDDDHEGDRQLEDFVNVIIEGREPLVKPEEALQVSEIVDAIYESSAKGTAIKLG